MYAKFGGIFGVAQGKNGDLYVSAPDKHVVLKIEFNKQEGTWSNVEMIAGTGAMGKGADGVLGTQCALDTPLGLSLIEDSSTGEVTDILITDWGNHRIRKLDMSTRVITTIAGTGTSGFSGEGTSATGAKINGPRNVFYDKSTGDVYIVDSNNHRIRRVSGGKISTVVGKTCSDSDGLGDEGQATGACLKSPFAFSMNDAGEWLIADTENKRVRKVYLNGTITTVAGGGTVTGDAVATSVKLRSVLSIAFLPSGEMLVVDYGTDCVIRKMDSSGFMKVIAGGDSKLPSSTNPIPAKRASIQPRVIAYARDESDAIFIGDDRGYVFMVSNRTKCYSVWSDNSTVCSGIGTCMGPDECKCEHGWTGHDCSVPYCYDIKANDKSVCSGHGSCIGVDECKCNRWEWMGADCSITHCFDTMSNETYACSGHGSCIGLDECECDDGWMGLDCSITHCFGFTSNLPDRVCSGKGKCARHNKCHCVDGFGGNKCQIRL